MFGKIKNFFSEMKAQNIAKEKQRRLEEISYVKYYISQESITCRCKGTAIPVFDASNKYHCLKCNSRFAHARHHLYKTLSDRSFLRAKYANSDSTYFMESKARELYEEAVKQMRNEK